MTEYSDNLFQKSPPSNFSKARDLRKTETQAEVILWKELRNRKLLGYKFRRQHPLGLYIADFYCHELKLVIEADGGYHKEKYQKQYDGNRDFSMQFSGVTVLRFTNTEIVNDISDILKKMKAEIKSIEKKMTSPYENSCVNEVAPTPLLEERGRVR